MRMEVRVEGGWGTYCPAPFQFAMAPRAAVLFLGHSSSMVTFFCNSSSDWTLGIPFLSFATSG